MRPLLETDFQHKFLILFEKTYCIFTFYWLIGPMCEIEVDENNGYVSIFLSQSSPEVKNLLPTSDVTSTK